MGKNSKLNKMILCTVIIYIITIYVFSASVDTIIISEIVFIILCAEMFLYFIRGEKLQLKMYFKLMSIFVIYSYLSSMWAIDSNLAISMSKTLALLVIMSVMMFSFFYNTNNIETIIKGLGIGGVTLSIYIFWYYGVANYLQGVISGQRMGSDIANANSLGMYAAVSVVICIYYALYNRKLKCYFISILPFIITIGSGSRKALILTISGILLLILFNIRKGKKIKYIFILMVFVIGFTSIIQLSFFSVVTDRMEGLVNLVTNKGEVDSSTLIREQMIKVGWNQFKSKPILGVGIGNSKYVVISEMGKNTYLHNNFIELLVNVGIIGFVLYYAMYIYIFLKMVPLIRMRDQMTIISFIVILLRFIMDYGSVSYYSKDTFIYLVLGFLVVTLPRNKKNG